MIAERRRTILAGLVGNILEWYDFAIYGYFAPIIAVRFFPSEDVTASLIAAYGAFAAGFLARPFGALFFGHIGDRFGRKPALLLSIAFMALPTTAIGLLPDHAAIGPAASIIMVLLRLLQGLSVGGEYTGSAVFLVEQAPSGSRAAFGSWSLFGAVAGILIGSASGAIIHTVMSEAAIAGWGWRLPFLLGVLVGFVGFLIRRGVPETVEKGARRAGATSPLVATLRDEWRPLLQMLGINVVNAVGFYLLFLYTTTFLVRQVRLAPSAAFDINTFSMVVLAAMIPIAARLSDRVGRRPLLLVSTIGIIVLAYPLLALMDHPDPLLIVLGQAGLATVMGVYYGANPTVFVELFPRRVRCTAVALGHNITLGALGGTTPMIATFLIDRTGNDLSIAWYLMAAAAVSLVATLPLRETAYAPID